MCHHFHQILGVIPTTHSIIYRLLWFHFDFYSLSLLFCFISSLKLQKHHIFQDLYHSLCLCSWNWTVFFFEFIFTISIYFTNMDISSAIIFNALLVEYIEKFINFLTVSFLKSGRRKVYLLVSVCVRFLPLAVVLVFFNVSRHGNETKRLH